MGIMGEKFTAASGRMVDVRTDGSLSFAKCNGYLSPECVADAEDYFQAKRDKELGRWRHGDVVVYPVDEDGDHTVVHEPTGERSWFGKQWDFDRDHDYVTRFGEAEKAYRAERRPWDDAKPGEVWVLTLEDGSEHDVFVHKDRTTGGREGVSTGGAYFDLDDGSQITAGRRVYPVVAS